MVVSNFFASLSEDAVINKITTIFEFGSHRFQYKHAEYEKPGFCRYFDLDPSLQAELNLTDFSFGVGDTFQTVNYRIQKWETAPPGYLSEPELIEKMEEHGIGTQGTIPLHIHKILLRNYVVALDGKVRRFVPTEMGVALAEGFFEIDPELIKPEVRQFIEQASDKICYNEMEYETVKETVMDIFTKKFIVFAADFHKILGKQVIK